MALPMRPVERTMVMSPIEIMNVRKTCEQSMSHQPSSAPVTGTPVLGQLLLQDPFLVGHMQYYRITSNMSILESA